MSTPTPDPRTCSDSDCETVLNAQDQLLEGQPEESLCDKHAKRLLTHGHRNYDPNPRGYRTDRAGWFYLNTHDDLAISGFGITNSEARRVNRHQDHGWTTVYLQRWRDGTIARRVENHVKSRLKEREIGAGAVADDMPQGGYTETVSFDDLSTEELRVLVEGAITEVAGSAQQLEFPHS